MSKADVCVGSSSRVVPVAPGLRAAPPLLGLDGGRLLLYPSAALFLRSGDGVEAF